MASRFRGWEAWRSRLRWRRAWSLRSTAREAVDFFSAALGLVWLAGFIDDLRELGRPFRLLAQIGGAMLLYAGGWRVMFSSSTAFAIFAQCLFMILFVNAFDFLDGADGLAAGITAAIALGYAAMPSVALSAFGYAVAWSLLGACVGFLIFNFPPAKYSWEIRGVRRWDSAWRS